MFKLDEQEESLYGEDMINHYRYGAFAIHPDLQGMGLGRYMHERNMKRVGGYRPASATRY